MAARRTARDGLRDDSSIDGLTGARLNEVAFPLGGIGAGTICLGGRGNLRDWEIYNSPGKGNDVGPALFALWCKPVGPRLDLRSNRGELAPVSAGRRSGGPDARVLEREFLPPFMDRGTYHGGHGVRRTWLPGLPRFREAVFTGQYPLATLDLRDPAVPLAVRLLAFNPMIPLNETDSGLPAAVFNWTFTNRTRRRIALSLAAVLRNPVAFRPGGGPNRQEFGQGNLNEFARDGDLAGLRMSATRIDPADPAFGTFAVVTNHRELDVQTHWHRGGGWWDADHLFWDDFAKDGRVETVTDATPAPDGRSEVADLVLHARLAPGQAVTFTIVLAWHLPNRLRRAHWPGLPEDDRTTLRNWYATQWADAWDVAKYAFENLERLTRQTQAYHDALFASTLPAAVLDAASSQASIPRTASCLRLADGSFHGFEGCNDASGCCPMNCTHVWNYAQSMAFLFPALERSVRETDFLRNTRKAGRAGLMAFRTILPTAPGQAACDCDPAALPRPANRYDAQTGLFEMFPAADGQMGTILRALREWRMSGDRQWLSRIWPDVVRALEFAWLGEDGAGKDAWDAGRTGVIRGRQHNTYDIEFFGPNPLTSVMYLGALRAGEELARAMGEPGRADEYRRIYQAGRAWVDRRLWSRGWYVQRVEVPAGLEVPADLRAPDGSPKYQVGGGCLSDQLLGQVLAHICGLGHLLDRRKVATAMGSSFRHNFRERVGDHANVQRVYAVGDEGGLLLCTWPRGGREQLPFPYCDEVWTGVEYQVAAGLIYEGLVEEGLTIVRAARARYAGHNRNPFNEVECGHHYARAMASWAVLLALSGYSYDAASGSMGFAPRIRPDDFRCFYSTGSSWGVFAQWVRPTRNRKNAPLTATLRVDYGAQQLRKLNLSPFGRDPEGSAPRLQMRKGKPSPTVRAYLKRTGATSRRTPVSATVSPGPAPGEVVVRFDPPVTIQAGQALTVRIG